MTALRSDPPHLQHLAYCCCRIFLRVSALCHDPVDQVSPIAQLHDEVDVNIVFICLLQRDYVGVAWQAAGANEMAQKSSSTSSGTGGGRQNTQGWVSQSVLLPSCTGVDMYSSVQFSPLVHVTCWLRAKGSSHWGEWVAMQ